MIYELWNLLTSFGEEKIKEITKPPFGKHLLSQFKLDKKFTNVNHGENGATPKSVFEKVKKYREEMESNPDRWFNFSLIERIKETRKVIGDYLNINSQNICLINEKIDGIQEILEKLSFGQGEKILILNIADLRVKSLLEKLKRVREIEIVEVNLTEEDINFDDEKFLKRIERVIKQNLPIKLGFFEQISSAPSFILPINKINKLLKDNNILSLIDGSQAIGQISLDISGMNPDFYVCNFNNWSFAPKSTAMIYINEKFKDLIYENLKNQAQNIYDFSACLSIKDAIIFMKSQNEIEVRKYIKSLAWEAGKHVASLWNTEILIKSPETSGAMVNVRIPCEDIKIINMAVKKTLEDYNTYLFCFTFGGKYYARFSAQIYNEIDDFIYSGRVFLKVLFECMDESV